MAVASPVKPESASKSAPVVAANPFTKAAKRKTETFLDASQAIDASAHTLQQIDIPATGWLRHLVLTFTAPGNAGATFVADAPWSLVDNVSLKDVNGQAILSLSGYDLFLANLLGGYTQHADPRKLPGYKADATGVAFSLRIPLEIIGRGALGVLANLNASMTYKLSITFAPSASLYATNAPANPVARVTGVVESWSNPAPQDLRGVANMTRPPAEGTTQNWSEHVAPVVLGQNTIRLPRVGNAIRNLVFVTRDATGARADLYPAELGVYFDGFLWHKAPIDYFKRRAVELYGYAPADIPLGVIVMPFTDDFDGTPGEEVGDFWVETSGATRFEIQGSFTAAGSLMILTNDVLAVAAPGGVGATLGAQS